LRQIGWIFLFVYLQLPCFIFYYKHPIIFYLPLTYGFDLGGDYVICCNLGNETFSHEFWSFVKIKIQIYVYSLGLPNAIKIKLTAPKCHLVFKWLQFCLKCITYVHESWCWEKLVLILKNLEFTTKKLGVYFTKNIQNCYFLVHCAWLKYKMLFKLWNIQICTRLLKNL